MASTSKRTATATLIDELIDAGYTVHIRHDEEAGYFEIHVEINSSTDIRVQHPLFGTVIQMIYGAVLGLDNSL